MKKLLYTLSLFLISTQLFATHGMGGEITWTCQGNSYVFIIKYYRDCNGILPNLPVHLETNHPTYAISGILMNLVSQTDISPPGDSTSGTIPCKICANGSGNGTSSIPGIVMEFIFQSNPVVLAGTPPATGWTFWYQDYARSDLLTNISSGGNYGYTLRSKMYPYNGFIAGQCRDASPYFAEKPSTIICTGYPFTYNHNAVDAELDSLYYTWGAPLNGTYNNLGPPYTGIPPTTAIPFAPGYSVNSQMPSTIQNASNVPAAINAITGEITYTSFTQGYFVTCTKVAAYKCGTIAAEIWREINVVLIAGCIIPVAGNPPNNPPIPTPPFPDPITGFPNQSYNTTIYAGDTLTFILPASDPDPHPNPILGVQSVTFNASGGEFGTGFINPNAGCFIPPCATLAPPPPIGPVPFGALVAFEWPVKCQHMGLDTNCTSISNVYNFVLRINDNYCPANGIRVATISVTVKRPPKLLPPRLKCVSVLNPFGDVELSWAPPAPKDTHYTFAQYEIWASLTGVAGTYIKLDSVYGGLNKYYETSLIIPAAKQMAELGTHAQNQSIYFQMYTRCGCDSDSLSIASNMARSMKLNAVQAGSSVDLAWNPVHNPLLATSHNKYYIYKEFPIGTWTLIDSTIHPDVNYTDPTTNTICDDTLTYRIQTGDDSLMCTSWSSFAGIRVINPAPIAVIAPSNPFVCSGNNVTLTANAGGTIYLWSPGGQNTQSINVATSGTYTVTITYVGGCASDTFTVVTVCQPGTCQLNLTGAAAICPGQNTSLSITSTPITPGTCPGGGQPYTYSYLDVTNNIVYGPFVTNTLPISFNVSPTSTTTYQLISFSATGAICGYGVIGPPITVTVMPTTSATLSGTDTMCFGQNVNLIVTFTGPGLWTFTYNGPSGVSAPIVTGTNPYVFSVSPATTFNYTLASISGSCPVGVFGNANITVIPLPTATISGTSDICIGQPTNLTINFTGQAPFDYTYLASGTPVGPFTTNLNSVIISVSPTATTNYTLPATVFGNGCSGSTLGSALVTVHPLPTATIAGSPVICIGDQTTIQIAFTGTGPFTYSYTVGPTSYGPIVATDNPEIINVSPTVTSICTVTSVSDAWCTGTTGGVATVTVNALPTAQISGTSTICDGDQTNLTINFTGAPPLTYSYLAGATPNGPFVTPNPSVTIPVSPSATTTYTVSSIEDANCTGTSLTGSAIVTIKPLPTAILNGNPTICNGQTANLTVTFTGLAPFTFSYFDGSVVGPITTSTNPYTITVSPIVTTNYSLFGNVTGAGCVGAVAGAATVTVNQLPSAIVNGTPTICAGDPTSFTITFAGVPPFTYTYLANGTPVGPIVASSNPEIIPVSPAVTTTYTVSVIIDDNCTGSSSGQAIVTVHPLPTAVISGTTGICEGSNTNLTITFTGTEPFTYTYNDGTTTSNTIITTNNPEIINVQPTATTTYTVTSIVDANCTGTVAGVATVTVYTIPSAIISDNSTICYGSTTSFKITFYTGVAPYTYEYSDGFSTFGPFTTSLNPEVVNVSPTSTKTYTLISINDAHCAGTYSGDAIVIVNDLPVPVITGINAICDGNTTVFDVGSVYTAYLWSNNATTQTITIGTGATYTVTVTDNNGCENSDTEVLTVNQTPVATFTNDTSLTCEAPIINLINTSSYPAGSQFQWDFGDTTQSTLTSPSHQYAQPGTYPITLIITTLAGCADTISQDMIVDFYPLAEAMFELDPSVTSVFNASVNFTDHSQYAITWHWDFGDGYYTSVQNSKHYFDEIGKYKVVLTVTNIAGCPDRYEQEVLITPFFIPNAFSPNGDGMNDLFFDAGYVMDVSSYNMTIFSRWGQKVFDNDDYRKFWRGYDKNGNKLPQGVYAYMIKVKTLSGKPYEYAGTVTLVR